MKGRGWWDGTIPNRHGVEIMLPEKLPEHPLSFTTFATTSFL